MGRITLKAIAQECNVSTATVSYALRRNSHIPAKTRERVRAVAERLGYRPDPALSSLSSRKNRDSATALLASVAVLYPNPRTSRATQLFATHCRHFKTKIAEFGCAVTDFHVHSEDFSPARLEQILRARGVKGILLGWGSWPEVMQSFPWKNYAVLSTGRTHLGHSIDKVSMNHFHALDDIFTRLEPFSIQRYGLILHHDCPEKTENLILGAYHANLLECERHVTPIPPFKYHLGSNAETLKAWFQAYRPQVIISHRIIDPLVLHQAGIRFPNPTRVVVIEIDEESSVDYSGIHTGANLGRTAATLLARKIRSDEIQGLVEPGKLILVKGTWRDGATLG